MESFAEGSGMPLGLGLALAQNRQAMNRFSSLSPEQQQQMIDQTKQIGSKQEMRSFVEQFANSGITTF